MPLYTISMFYVLKLLDIYVQGVPFIMFVSMVAVMGCPDMYRLLFALMLLCTGTH